MEHGTKARARAKTGPRRDPMTNAERQAAYRKRHVQDVDGQGERLNMVVPIQTKAQLSRLTKHYGVTQRELLARVLAEAESKVVDGLSRQRRRPTMTVRSNVSTATVPRASSLVGLPATDLQPKLAVRAQADQLQRLVIGLAVD